MFLILSLVFSKSSDSDTILRSFLGKDIKIFLSAYSHIHLAANMATDDGDFITISKYVSTKQFNYNDRAKLNRNGKEFTITLGDDKMCVVDKKRLGKCGDGDTDSFEISRAMFGFVIKHNNLCLTKKDFLGLKMAECTEGDDQQFDFKFVTDANKCQELIDKENKSKGNDKGDKNNYKKVDIDDKSKMNTARSSIIDRSGHITPLNVYPETYPAFIENTRPTAGLTLGEVSSMSGQKNNYSTQPVSGLGWLKNRPDGNSNVSMGNASAFSQNDNKYANNIDVWKANTGGPDTSSKTPEGNNNPLRDQNDRFDDIETQYKTPYGTMWFTQSEPKMPENMDQIIKERGAMQ